MSSPRQWHAEFNELLILLATLLEHVSCFFISSKISITKNFFYFITIVAGPIAERSKWSDLYCGQGGLGSNPGKGMCFIWDDVYKVEAILLVSTLHD